MNNNRLIHSLGVANKMVSIAKDMNLSDEEINACFIIGYNHDIGYFFSGDVNTHNKIGGEVLKNNNFKYWKEIYYHGIYNPEYKSLFLDILNMADMQINSKGEDVGYESRLEEIENKHGRNSLSYVNSSKIVEEILSNANN